MKPKSAAFRIITASQNDGQFGIEQDGIVVATVENSAGKWQQLSGKPLSKELLESICNHIEAHYGQV